MNDHKTQIAELDIKIAALKAEQDEAYDNLSPKQTGELDRQLREVRAAWEEAIEAVVDEASWNLESARTEANENLLTAMATIRQQFGNDVVDGALRQESDLAPDLNLEQNLNESLPDTIARAEQQAEEEGGERSPAKKPMPIPIEAPALLQ